MTPSRLEKKSFHSSPLLSRLLEVHPEVKDLNIKGDLPAFTIDDHGRLLPRILTIVGSRKNTTYGKRVLEMLLHGFEKDEVIILSGLAVGIDGIAHRAALDNGLLTIAIPGSGLGDSVLYPSTHKTLAKEILEHGGALISELNESDQPAPWTFPARNRIMAALSDAVLIIEAEEKSGTLITARQALELGKDIGAVPGDIFNPTSYGPLALIRDGAMPITSSNDLRALLTLPEKDAEEKTNLDLNEQEKSIMDLLREPKEKDVLLEESGMELSDFLMTMTTLEMKNYIEETFGEVRKIV